MRFNRLAMIGGASQREDKLTGLRASTETPKFIGTAREYQLTAENRLKAPSSFFWDTVVNLTSVERMEYLPSPSGSVPPA
jgi:hypothetical protein